MKRQLALLLIQAGIAFGCCSGAFAGDADVAACEKAVTMSDVDACATILSRQPEKSMWVARRACLASDWRSKAPNFVKNLMSRIAIDAFSETYERQPNVFFNNIGLFAICLGGLETTEAQEAKVVKLSDAVALRLEQIAQSGQGRGNALWVAGVAEKLIDTNERHPENVLKRLAFLEIDALALTLETQPLEFFENLEGVMRLADKLGKLGVTESEAPKFVRLRQEAIRGLKQAISRSTGSEQAKLEQTMTWFKQRTNQLYIGVQQPSPNATVATADDVDTSSNRIALVIGNSKYRSAPELANTARDAAAIAAKLKGLGFTSVIEKQDLGLADLTAVLKEFGDAAAAADWAVVYYAGHGIEVGGLNYLIPVDAKLQDARHVEDEAVPLSRLLSKVESARKLRLVLLDACRDNPFIPGMRVASNATRSIGRGLAKIDAPSGILVGYAAREGQVAADGSGEHSPFAEALLKHLDEPDIEIEILMRRVRDTVLSSTGSRQEPFTYGSLPATKFYLKAH